MATEVLKFEGEFGSLRRQLLAFTGGARREIARLQTQVAQRQLNIARTVRTQEKRFEREQIAALRLRQRQLRESQQEVSGLTRAFDRAKIAAALVAVAGVFLITRALARAVQFGIKLNAEFEAMRVGVAATLAGNAKIVDALGRQLTGVDAVVAAQKLSADIQQKILQITLETGGTLDITLEAFRIALPLFLQAGGTLEDTLDIVKRLNLAAIAIGIPIDLVRLQIDDIARGVITTRTTLARVLGITQDQLRAAREQGRLIDFIRSKTQAFIDAQDLLLGKFNAVVNRVKALGQEFARAATSGGFNVLREALKGLIDQVAVFDEKTREFKGFRPEIQETIDKLNRSFSDMIAAIRDALPDVKEFAKALNSIFRGVGFVSRNLTAGQRRRNLLELIGIPSREAIAQTIKDTEVGDKIARAFEVAFKSGLLERKGNIARLFEEFLQNEVDTLDLDKLLKEFTANTSVALRKATAEALFAKLTDDVLIRQAGQLAQLEIRLDKTREAAAKNPAAFLAAENAIKSFNEGLAQVFGDTDVKRIQDFAGVIAKSFDELEKFRQKAEDIKRSRTLDFQARIILPDPDKLEDEIKKAFKGLDIGGADAPTFLATESLLESIRAAGEVARKESERTARVGELLRNRQFDIDRRRIELLFDNEREKITALHRLEVDQILTRARIEGATIEELAELRRILNEELQLKLVDAQKQRFESLLSEIKSSAAAVFDDMLTRGKNVFRSLVDFIRGIFNTVLRTIFAALVENLAKKVLEFIGPVIRKGGGIFEKIADILGLPGGKKSTDQKEATDKNTVSTDKNTAAIDRLTGAMTGTGGLFSFFGSGGGRGGGGIFGAISKILGGGGSKGDDSSGGIFGAISNIFGGLFSKSKSSSGIDVDAIAKGRGVFNVFGSGQGGLSKISGFIKGAGALAGIPLLLQSLSTGGKLGKALGIAGGALTGFAFGGPIGAAIGAVAGGFLAGIIGGARRREAARQKRVQEAIKRQTVEFPEQKLFQFANAGSIRDIFASTFSGSGSAQSPFFAVPQPAGFSTGMSPIVVSPTFNVQAFDSEGVDKFFRRNGRRISEVMHQDIQAIASEGATSSQVIRRRIHRASNPV